MWYLVTAVIFFVGGFVSCWIWKQKMIKELEAGLERISKPVLHSSDKTE